MQWTITVRIVVGCALCFVSTESIANPDALTADAKIDILLERVNDLERTVEDQQQEIDGLRRSTEGVSPDPTMGGARNLFNPSRGWLANYGGFDLDLAVHGFLNLELIDAEHDGARGGDSTFDLHHANVFVDVQYRENLRSHLEIEFEHAFEDVEIDQAFLEWSLAPSFVLTAGRFYAPFGIERFAWYPMSNQLVSRPSPFRQIVPGNFYETGIMASGNLGCCDELQITYEFAVSNGLGDDAATDRRGSRQSRDNNSDKAFTGRVAAVVGSLLEVGVSGHVQDYESTGPDQQLYFVGTDLAARWRGFELRAEYVFADLERRRMGNLRQHGWYTQLAYTFQLDREWLDAVTVVGRVDSVRLGDNDKEGDDQRRWALGSVFRIYDHLQLKAEYQWVTERGVDLENNAFLAAFVVDF